MTHTQLTHAQAAHAERCPPRKPRGKRWTPHDRHTTSARLAMCAAAVVGVAGGAGGCGGRGDMWNRSFVDAHAFGLIDAVAISDPDAERVLLLTTDADRHVSATPVAIQRGFRAEAVAPDRSKLFVVSAGDSGVQPPAAGRAAQRPALEVIARSSATATRYPLSEPLSGLALDPQGEWAVLFADQASSSLVSNPNELVLVDLKRPASSGATPNPIVHALRSFGGQPQRFTFTDVLQLPGGPRRLLIVETQQDVAIIDLLHPTAAETTIQLTSGLSTQVRQPAGVVVSDGDPAATDDARIAIRLVNDSTVILAQLVPGVGEDFRPELNLSDLGTGPTGIVGVPTDAAFVRTDGGALALAVLVPSLSKAVLIDPTTGATQDVALPADYQRLSLVTGQAAAAPGPTAVDVALLWQSRIGGDGGVAFWELGVTAGQPYRSVETVGVTTGVTTVMDVAGAHPELKILGTDTNSFFVLDLKTRTSAPFSTMSGVSIMPSTAGDRAWVFFPRAPELATVDLTTLHPQPMSIERPIAALFEIAATDGAAAGSSARSLIAWDPTGTGGVTVYDAAADVGAAVGTGARAIDDHRTYDGILLEGLDAKLP